jgi:hypothetical protein
MVAAFEPEAVALGSSRGYETPSSKSLLRWTVVLSDVLTFFPAALLSARLLRPAAGAARAAGAGAGAGASAELFALAALLLQPAHVLTDHGHFQYNCISLGLALGGAVAIAAHGRRVLGSVLFCAALSHKQMSLAYAPAFFAHLLGSSLQAPGLPRQVGLLAEGGGCWLGAGSAWGCRAGAVAWPGRFCASHNGPSSTMPSAHESNMAHAQRDTHTSHPAINDQVSAVAVLGVTVIASFGVMWAPYLTSLDSLMEVCACARMCMCVCVCVCARARAHARALPRKRGCARVGVCGCLRAHVHVHDALGPWRRRKLGWLASCARSMVVCMPPKPTACHLPSH